MENFVTIATGWKSLTTVSKVSVLDFWEGSGYSSLMDWLLPKTKLSIAFIQLNNSELFNMPEISKSIQLNVPTTE